MVDTRDRYQRHVALLLDEIEDRRHRLDVLQVSGVRPGGLRELEAEFESLRNELAAAVGFAAGSLS